MFDYKTPYQKELYKNQKLVRGLLKKNDTKIINKIRKEAKKRGFKFRYLLQKVKQERALQAFFTIDPARQNFFQKCTGTFIQTISNVSNLQNISNGYVDKGIVSKTTKGSPVHFSWNSNIKNIGSQDCYAHCIYTHEAGGSQNYGYRAVEKFIADCSSTSGVNNSIYFFAICDGEYYTAKRKRDLQALAPSNLLVCSIDELANFL